MDREKSRVPSAKRVGIMDQVSRVWIRRDSIRLRSGHKQGRTLPGPVPRLVVSRSSQFRLRLPALLVAKFVDCI